MFYLFNFYKLQKEYSADQSSFVNNAYKTLGNDLDRAFYLLKVTFIHFLHLIGHE
jgi:DnaJ-domain-containing protein 1